MEGTEIVCNGAFSTTPANRLFNRKELVEYQRYFYYDTVLKNKNNELSKKEKKNSIAHSNSFLC